MQAKKLNKFSRRDLFRGFMRHVRGQDMEEESSGFDPDIVQADRLLREKDYELAAQSYEACLLKEPLHQEALRKLGFCRLRLGDSHEARKVWERLLTIKPGDDYAVLYTGLSHAIDGDIQAAAAAWRKYFNIKTPHIQREINLTLALVERGDDLEPQEVVRSIEQAIASQKGNLHSA
ncbi:tetratricopeptide repeat protein [Desulfonatronovibrio magnus]|uniref:tetratricopeptide repeat protein n=1 Tax=Desulfonatronovibrio magnus TaxID=698827 RepID=UPI0005EBD54D|nr:tetratricopeptide repeat protein [Desulfonatronovibrio magnus]